MLDSGPKRLWLYPAAKEYGTRGKRKYRCQEASLRRRLADKTLGIKQYLMKSLSLLQLSVPPFSGLRWPGGKVSVSGLEAFQVRNQILSKNCRVSGLVRIKSVGAQCPPSGVTRSLERRIPAQSWFSSYDHGSKL
ncbi:hypothetical protein AVEN_239843-1 [Araneus ventricosus]|uniref:Uncharacterized protein n=1 Tax=Araneus ventricosus TaxID=182803 RepID=A0A4Y2LCH2_ARAVE|nr:hypothetical protein AVEN_239843-1 [Araneus ventricosus]